MKNLADNSKTPANNSRDRSAGMAATIFLSSLALWNFALLILIITSLTLRDGNTDWTKTWENWENATSTFEHIATVAGLIIGGLFAYYKFFKGRVFVPRLETCLTVKSICKDNTGYLIASLELKNVGLSRVDIHQKGTALRVSSCAGRPPLGKAESVAW